MDSMGRRVTSSIVRRKQWQEKSDPGLKRPGLHSGWLTTFMNVKSSFDLSWFRLSFVKYKG